MDNSHSQMNLVCPSRFFPFAVGESLAPQCVYHRPFLLPSVAKLGVHVTLFGTSTAMCEVTVDLGLQNTLKSCFCLAGAR